MNRIHSAALDLNLLKLFDAVMETRSVSRAAVLLGLSQSAVSHGLARLREVVGDPLFIRSGGRMEPTARAQRLAEPMRDALVLAASALSPDAAQAFDPAAGRRVFTIGAGDYAAAVLLGGFVAEVAAAGWDLGIAVLPVDRQSAPAMLDAGQIDLALGLLPQRRRWHEGRVLYEEVQACVFDGARLGIAAPIVLEQFCALPQIVPSLHGDFTSWVEEELDRLGQRRRVVMATAHFLSIPMLLKQVPAVATLPRRLCMACANAAALTVSPLPFPPRRFEISMLWHRRDSNAAAQIWLRDRIAAHNSPAAV
ncbi:LysR family transcriptional regulator [Falsiroseomonas sp. E2-1-a20]|uniref:LysR family transcriptional regulator n=1 Tax=Falsiroseomonas sp. E2-1-a20 TaxID=3239300 RepID=UPI003F382131